MSVPPLGRREQHKQATRRALEQASQRLFAERGFEHTTVREIADEAGVTERTFFRYFASKEALVFEKVLDFLPRLQERIRQRPQEEGPLAAVKGALLDRGGVEALQAPLWLFRDGPPAGRLRATGPQVLLHTEQALADVLRERLADQGAEDVDLHADTSARVAMALMRSILIRDWQLGQGPGGGRPSLDELVEAAFAVVGC